MLSPVPLQRLYVICALLFQLALIVHFAIRKWRFAWIVRWGWLFYALSLPFAVASLVILLEGESWFFWLGGFLYLVWSIFGYVVEYILGITTWRSPIRWPIFVPYVMLYLATVMFYWWPLARIGRPLWLVATALFVIGTTLNAISHGGPEEATD